MTAEKWTLIEWYMRNVPKFHQDPEEEFKAYNQIININHTITEWVSLEGTTADPLVQPSCLSGAIPERMAWDCIQTVLQYLQ